jgi:hypothetical protein
MIGVAMKTPSMRTILRVAIPALWLLAMGTLALEHWGGGRDGMTGGGAMRAPTERLLGERWMGVYLDGRKAGYSMTRLARTTDGFSLAGRLSLNVKLLGEPREIATTLDALLGPDLRLRSFEASLNADIPLRARGSVEGGTLLVTVETPGGAETFTVAMAEAPAVEDALLAAVAAGDLREGRSFTMPVLDPLSLRIEDAHLMVTGRETVTIGAREYEAHVLRGKVGGMAFTAWVDDAGEVLREETPLGFAFVRETREEALAEAAPPEDLIRRVAVPIDLAMPAHPRLLRLRVRGIETSGLALAGGRQTFEDGVLTIREETPGGTISSAQGPDSHYLAPSTGVESADPGIAALARKITAGASSPDERARRVMEWVHGNMTREIVVGAPSARRVLATLRGDCNEHTVLAAALARAAGVPARMAGGLVFLDDAFYYHAWPEVWLGGWVAVDPTLGQFPADAAHVRLVAGGLEGFRGLLSVMGAIRLEGLEAR